MDATQRKIFKQILSKDTTGITFLTGAGGTGKSFLIKQIVEACKRNEEEWDCRLTATTNSCASDLGGKTLFKEMRLGLLSNMSKEELTRRCKFLKKHFTPNEGQTILWIIDEACMMHETDFEKFVLFCELVCPLPKPSKKRKRTTTKSGNCVAARGWKSAIKVVLSGDFLQLPPVNSKTFLFETKLWKQCVTNTYYLEKNFRQDDPNDKEFFDLRTRVRIGAPTDDDIALLSERNIDVDLNVDKKGRLPTLIFSKRDDVALQNREKLKQVASRFVFRYAATNGYKKYTANLKVRYAKTTDLRQKLEADQIFEFHDMLGDPSFRVRTSNGGRFGGAGAGGGYHDVQKSITTMIADLPKKTRMEDSLDLKLGCQVLVCENLDVVEELYNGARAQVIGFYDRKTKTRLLSETDLEKHFITTKIMNTTSIPPLPATIAAAATPLVAAPKPTPTSGAQFMNFLKTQIKSSNSKDVALPKVEPIVSTPNKTSTPTPTLVVAPNSTNSVPAVSKFMSFLSNQLQVTTSTTTTAANGVPIVSATAPVSVAESTTKIPIVESKTKMVADVRIVECSMRELQYCPIVRLEKTGQEHIIDPYCCEESVDNLLPPSADATHKTTRVFFKQLPLVLAYALTIHKVQGMTLDYVKADCRMFFETGMFYVILSRVRSLKCIAFSNFAGSCIQANPKAVDYYHRLSLQVAKEKAKEKKRVEEEESDDDNNDENNSGDDDDGNHEFE